MAETVAGAADVPVAVVGAIVDAAGAADAPVAAGAAIVAGAAVRAGEGTRNSFGGDSHGYDESHVGPRRASRGPFVTAQWLLRLQPLASDAR